MGLLVGFGKNSKKSFSFLLFFGLWKKYDLKILTTNTRLFPLCFLNFGIPNNLIGSHYMKI
jgi:hypothetical protein